MEHLCLRTESAHTFQVLEPYEKKGFELVSIKSCGGGSLIVLRASGAACAAGRAMATKVLKQLPTGATLATSASLEEALNWMNESLGPREIVQWTADEEPSCWTRLDAIDELLGSHNGNREYFLLEELVGGSDATAQAAAGARFCAQLRRDSYVPVRMPASKGALFHEVEEAASQWFKQSEEEKIEQAGLYGHVDRKFTGYRNGNFREQLEVRQELDGVWAGDVYVLKELQPRRFQPALRSLVCELDRIARGLLRHIARDVGADDGFFDSLLDAPPPPPAEKALHTAPGDGANMHTSPGEDAPPPSLSHSLIRVCRYDADDEGVYGSNVLCEQHNDVGFITLDACASTPGLEAVRRADGLWIPVEQAPPPPDGSVVLLVMVGETLSRLTADYYAPCKHRVVAPAVGERIGLPFLFRGRSDAVLNTRPTRDKCAASGRAAHLAEMETTTIKELPAFDSAKSILKGWFRSAKNNDFKTP